MNTVGNSESEVRCIPLDAIQVDETVQQRAAGTSQEVIREYAAAMRDGLAFPRVDVFGNGDGPFFLGGGFHRLKARQLAHPDVKDIDCNVHPGDRDDALLFACGANARHGLPRTRSDKRKAVTTLILSERWGGWSDRAIAKQCAVSHTYVASVRSEYLATLPDAGPQEQTAAMDACLAPDSATDKPTAAPVRRRTVRRGGRRYDMRTARIGGGGRPPKDEVTKLQRAFGRFQRALGGASELARKTFVEHRRGEIMALVGASEPPNPKAPNPKAANPEAPPSEPPSSGEVESATVPPAQARAYGIAETSRLTRGSAPNRSHKNAPNRHRFSGDNQPPKSKRGRPKGSPNKFSRNLREDLMEATERVGRDGQGELGGVGYLMWLARAEPKSYAMLLRGMLPTELRATVTLKPVLTRDEALAEMRARGLPTEWIENLDKVDQELGPDDDPNPYDHNVIDLKPNPPAESAE
jgi:ParB-like nuclease domain